MKAFKVKIMESISFDDSQSAINKALLRESTFCFVVYFLKNDEDTILYLKNTHTHIYFNMIT